MKKRTKRNIKIYLFTAITATFALFGTMSGMGKIKLQEAEAAPLNQETIDLRIVGTTDLHGQLNSKDYEQGVDYNNGGLARVFNLIQNIRSEMPKENIITVDAGDTLYDYTTEYIFSENQNVVQPIYEAMSKMGYDAITLGNHDFDYGYDYIQRQLNGSGLRDITIVSNVTDSKSGDHPFLENMLITRKIETSEGNEVEVKIGIIGQTIPALTSKTHSYTGILKVEDILTNAQTQATKLKEMGADIIIALSHTGMGPETPELNFKNVAYALTKIPEIDVVVCGHEHHLFPTTDLTSATFKLPNVDKKTCLINGKNVIMAGDRGRAVGVVDLTLEVSGDSFEIVDRSSQIRLVTADTTVEDTAIANSYGYWEARLSEYSTNIIAKLQAGTVIQNYFGLLGDNFAIQLLNDSKIDYVSRFINTTGKTYKDYPIVAASTYASYGVESVDEFINIHDSITESKLSSIQPYNNYVYVYTITGKQLKEWLEWTASAYETTTVDTKWNNGAMATLMKKTSLKSLIKEAWLDDWSSFYVFDGIDYVIDPSTPPRYDINGTQISNNHRISSVKYNGKSVDDSTVMLLATNKITQPNDANKGVDKQVALNGFVRMQVILSNYIEQISSNGNILPQLDYNWRVTLPFGNEFLVKAPYYAHDLITGSPWYKEYLVESSKYRYYIASYPVENGDTVGPHIVATPVITSATNSPYSVAVNVSDSSTIKKVGYLSGEYDANHNGWVVATELSSDNTFRVTKNGTYSIYAEDYAGNKTVYKLVIDNFSDNLLSSPKIDTYTNRKTKITGHGEPNTTIVFEAYTGTYQSKIGSNGSFSYALPSQPSGTAVIVYIKDDAKGLESAHISVEVKRTGPNQPTISPISNNAGYISGSIHDTDAEEPIAIIGDTVYVSKAGGKALYEANTEIYDSSLKIVEVSTEIDDTGYFIMLLPPQDSENTVTIYNMDHLSRNSRAATTTVVEATPNAPFVYEITNIERTIRGVVPNTIKKTFDINLTIDDVTYTTTTDENGNFAFEYTKQLQVDEAIIVVATDRKNGATRISYPTKVIVQNIDNYVRTNSTNLTFNKITDKSYLISGFYMELGTVYLAVTEGEGKNFKSTLLLTETDDTGKFKYRIDGKLDAGVTIYAMARFTDGKILIANKTTVIGGRPDAPSLAKPITNADKTAWVIAKKDCEVALTIGSKVYTSTVYQYDEVTGNYVYSFDIDRGVSGTAISITATNTSGISDVFTSKMEKAAPDQPLVNVIKAGDTVITGKVELLDYNVTTVTASTTENTTTDAKEVEVPKRFKDATPKVASTQTRIIAQIGDKTYEGTIDDKGKYSITIPAQVAGVEVSVWGRNKAGRGPLIKVIVM